MIDALLGKFYKYIIIGLIVIIGGQLWYSNHLAGKLSKADAVREKAVKDAVQPYEEAIAQAQEEKAAIMQTWSAKIIEVEQNALKKIQAANAAYRDADLASIRLSKQLASAKQRLPTATKETVIEYVYTGNELLESCTAEYRSMAEAADQHAIDAQRLSDAWPDK